MDVRTLQEKYLALTMVCSSSDALIFPRLPPISSRHFSEDNT